VYINASITIFVLPLNLFVRKLMILIVKYSKSDENSNRYTQVIPSCPIYTDILKSIFYHLIFNKSYNIMVKKYHSMAFKV